MRSIFGECTGNVRSTPTPNDCFRTVKVSRTPDPWRAITTPSNTWVRRRVPSMTWKWTRTRSPASKRGTFFSWRCSMLSMIVLIVREGVAGVKKRVAPSGPARASDSRRLDLERALRSATPALLETPLADPGVIARQQHLGHTPAAVAGGPGVVRILGRAGERLREGLLDGALSMPERPGQLPHHRVGDDHRRELTAREHVRADRDRVVGEVLAD